MGVELTYHPPALECALTRPTAPSEGENSFLQKKESAVHLTPNPCLASGVQEEASGGRGKNGGNLVTVFQVLKLCRSYDASTNNYNERKRKCPCQTIKWHG